MVTEELGRYEPSPAPLDVKRVPEYIQRELRRIGGLIQEYGEKVDTLQTSISAASNQLSASTGITLISSGGLWVIELDRGVSMTLSGVYTFQGEVNYLAEVSVSATLDQWGLVRNQYGYEELGAPAGAGYAGKYWIDYDAPANAKWWGWEMDLSHSGIIYLTTVNDSAPYSYHHALEIRRSANVITELHYGNSIDNPSHYLFGYLTMQGLGMDLLAPTDWGIYLGSNNAAADEKWWSIESSANNHAIHLFVSPDSFAVKRNVFKARRSASVVHEIFYGNQGDLPTHHFEGYPRFSSGYADVVGTTYAGFWWQAASLTANEQWFGIEHTGVDTRVALRTVNDAANSYKDILAWSRSAEDIINIEYGNSTDNPAHAFSGPVSLNSTLNIAGAASLASTLVVTGVATFDNVLSLRTSANPTLQHDVATGFTSDWTFYYNGTLTALIRWQPTTNVLEFYDRDPSPVLTGQFDFDTGDFQCDGYMWASGEQKNAIVAGNLGSPTMPFGSSTDLDVGITAQSVTAGDQVGFYAYMQDGTRQWRCFFGLHDNDAWGMLMTGASIAASTPFKIMVASASLLEADYQGAVRLYYNNSTKLATTNTGVQVTGNVELGSGGPTWTAGSGSPEGVVTAPVGSLYSRTDGGAATSLYVKESGTGNTGWVGK